MGVRGCRGLRRGALSIALGFGLFAALALPSAAAMAAGPTGVLDSRAWEMVSPVEKNGGEVAPLGGGALAAAAGGGALAFASEASFGQAEGAPPLSQYVATRGAAGWSTVNVTPPLLAGTYSAESGDADPYLAFSADLSRALLSSGWACRGASPCAEENTPLGPGGPAGYRNLYLHEGSTYTPLITNGNFGGHLPPDPSELSLAFLEASPDLSCVVFEANGTFYEWREGDATIPPLAGGCSGAGGFTPPGAIAVLGSNAGESVVFYTKADGIYRWQGGTETKIVADANLSHLPPATGPSAVAANGNRLFFTAGDSLAPTADSNGQPDAYEWEAQGTGSCTAGPGCLGLLSSGRTGSASFAAASASGDDAYFLTTVSLLPADPSGLDVYDARASGGIPEPAPGIECEGDDCQGPPFVPQEPAPPTAVISGPENPPLRFPGPKAKVCPKGKHRVKRHGKRICVKKKGKHRK
ncbi:MAG TPA: hypothetical protein VFP23_00625 [Solirubrobacterales bacterium]|nr:hypothetical protein [Solirubrobacterales bacterium]